MGVSFEEARRETVRYHTELYDENELFSEGSWLAEPEEWILRIVRENFEGKDVRILDLGCGVGRNAIPIAEIIGGGGRVVCVDLLAKAIGKLKKNAEAHGVEGKIEGVVADLEDFVIEEDEVFDFVVSFGVLQHLRSKEALERELREIGEGVKVGGLVYIHLNAENRERDKVTGRTLPVAVELDMGAEEFFSLAEGVFSGWNLIENEVENYGEEYEYGGRTVLWSSKDVVMVFRRV